MGNRSIPAETKQAILEDAKVRILEGHTLLQIAESHGITRNTLRNWLNESNGTCKTRECRKCGAIYSTPNCKECDKARNKAYREANVAKLKEKRKEYNAKHVEEKKAYQAEWRAKSQEKIGEYLELNAERIKQQRREYQQQNPEIGKAWKKANPEKVAQMRKAWEAANPDSMRIRVNTRRARKKANGGKLSPDIVDKLYKLQKGKCPCCKESLGGDYHIDHIVPLYLGGTNTDDNVQLLRAACNREKHTKHPVTFMQQKGYLL